MPSACAASTRPWPAMIFRSLSISTGLTKPNSRRLALIWAIWLSLCVLAFRAYGTSSSIGTRASCSGINHAAFTSPGPAGPTLFLFAIPKPPKFPLHWEKISHGSPAAVRRPAAENFFGVGGSPGNLAISRQSRARRACTALVQASALPAALAARFSSAFCHGLCAVAAVAQALQIAAVRELLPVAVMRLDVIHVRRPGANAMPCTLPAPLLTQQLRRPEIIRPELGAVPCAPLPGLR